MENCSSFLGSYLSFARYVGRLLHRSTPLSLSLSLSIRTDVEISATRAVTYLLDLLDLLRYGSRVLESSLVWSGRVWFGR